MARRQGELRRHRSAPHVRRKASVITINVASFNGSALAVPLAAHFDEMGGNIGRADTNQLVLPDPERTISRVHAQVVYRNGRYAIVDRGSNAISVNGRPLGNGQESTIQAGDEIQIGGYAMRVVAATATPVPGGKADDPFADFGGLFGAAPAGSQPASAGRGDPLAGFGQPAQPPAPGRSAAMPPPASAAAAAGGIPDDWDPFAPDPVSPPRPDDFARSLGGGGGAGNFGLEVGGRGAGPLIPDWPGSGGGSGSADSIDNLFGLAPARAGADPFANSALSQAAALPNMAGHADPMKALGSLTKASASAAADNRSELQTPIMLPPAARPAAVPPPLAPQPAAPKGAAVMSWDEPSGDGRTIIRAKPVPAPKPAPDQGGSAAAASIPAAAPIATPTPAPAPGPAPATMRNVAGTAAPAASGAAASPAAAAAQAAHPAVSAAVGRVPAPPPPTRPRATASAEPAAAVDAASLLAALQDGLGVDGLAIDALTPELMRLLGQLVHEATKGTVDLLVARAALKREVRAEVTMIVARENNPLKFSPSVEVALSHLLKPTARGFMAPELAMRDAYDDLRAHQFGFLAGMRAALEGVLKRFDPVVLESKLTQGSVLSNLLPGSRKARMWDLFNELYGQISAEASDDFHELFGKEFLRAYESYIDELAKDRS